jgi:hypothetical protein
MLVRFSLKGIIFLGVLSPRYLTEGVSIVYAEIRTPANTPART